MPVVQAFRPAAPGSPEGLRYGIYGFAAACLTLALAAQTGAGSGVQDPAWSPDGKRLATSHFRSHLDLRPGRHCL